MTPTSYKRALFNKKLVFLGHNCDISAKVFARQNEDSEFILGLTA